MPRHTVTVGSEWFVYSYQVSREIDPDLGSPGEQLIGVKYTVTEVRTRENFPDLPEIEYDRVYGMFETGMQWWCHIAWLKPWKPPTPPVPLKIEEFQRILLRTPEGVL